MSIMAESRQSPADDLVDTALDVMREALGVPTLQADDDALDQGATSLVIVRILTECGKRFGLTISPRALAGVVSARRIAEVGASAGAQK